MAKEILQCLRNLTCQQAGRASRLHYLNSSTRFVLIKKWIAFKLLQSDILRKLFWQLSLTAEARRAMDRHAAERPNYITTKVSHQFPFHFVMPFHHKPKC
jgi:hypothetical protein